MCKQWDQDCNQCKEKAISQLTDCRSLGINLHSAPSFPATGILIFTIPTGKKEGFQQIQWRRSRVMGLSASHHMCSVVGAQSWIKKREGRRSNFLHKSVQHGFERNRYSAFAKIENCQINMLSFLTRVIFLSRYDVQETGALTGEWSYAGRDQEISLFGKL